MLKMFNIRQLCYPDSFLRDTGITMSARFLFDCLFLLIYAVVEQTF